MAEIHVPVTADNDPSTVLGCTGCGWQPDFTSRDWRPSAVQYIVKHAYLNPDQRTGVLQHRHSRDESDQPYPEAEDLEVEEEQNPIAWDLVMLILVLAVGVILIEVIWW